MAARRKRRTSNTVMKDVLRPGRKIDPLPAEPAALEEPVAETKLENNSPPEPAKTRARRSSTKAEVPDNGDYVGQIRQTQAMQAILQELKNQERTLLVNKIVVTELERYCSTKDLIPNILSADNRETVEKAQQGLQEIQARLDRVAAVHLGVRKVQRALQKLETMARHDLAVHGHVTPKTSKPSADQLITTVLPELQIYQDSWETFSRVCRDVQDHLGSAKEVIRIQMKLDENLHWAQRSGA